MHCTKMLFRVYDPGVLAAEAEGSGGQDGGDEGGVQEQDEDVAHGQHFSQIKTHRKLIKLLDASVIRERQKLCPSFVG